MKYYTVYQITNLLDGKIYIGAHQTKKLDDGYMGSGIRIKLAIQKYGEEHFHKEILHVLSSADEMYEKEAELVTEEFVASTDTYNLKTGGVAGWSQEALRKAKETRITNGTWGKPTFVGRKHTDKTKKKMSASSKGKQAGKKNSQFGKKWIFNKMLRENRKIPKNEPVPDGWELGRVMNFNVLNEKLKLEEKKLEKEEKRVNKVKEHTLKAIEEFLNSDFPSLNRFCAERYEYTSKTLLTRMAKYLPGYTSISKRGDKNLKEKLRILFTR